MGFGEIAAVMVHGEILEPRREICEKASPHRSLFIEILLPHQLKQFLFLWAMRSNYLFRT
jgi:hypothetical protein